MRISDWSSDVCSSDLDLDAGPDRQRQVTAADIAALGAATHEEDVSECINVALGGKVRDMPEMLAKAAAVGVAEIRIIRALAISALAPARLRAEVAGGAHPATVVSARSSGIFWKERGAENGRTVLGAHGWQ